MEKGEKKQLKLDDMLFLQNVVTFLVIEISACTHTHTPTHTYTNTGYVSQE